MSGAAWLQNQWYAQRRPSPALWLLLPLHALFVWGSALRRWAYRRGWLAQRHLPVPVIVVGNLVAGGAGKTPLVLWISQTLKARGWHPGIISRGYRGAAGDSRAVRSGASAAEVGDEPLLLAQRSGVPVWIGRDRVAAGQALLAAHPEVNVVIADDGLQHYRLGRQVEVVVFDGRGAGNGWRLPLGPLREPLGRLRSASLLVFNGAESPGLIAAAGALPHFGMILRPGRFYRLGHPEIQCVAAGLKGRDLHAVAGMAAPQRFFDTLAALGLEFAAHPFPDHHAYVAADLDFGPGRVVLMTEKDAVKCAGRVAGEVWVLPVQAELPPQLAEVLVEKINGRQTA